MEFGLDVGTYGPLATQKNVLALARFAEANGFSALWLADHVVFPVAVASRYPYSPSGSFPVEHDAPLLEPLATMGVLIGATERLRIGTAVLVIPYRNPVLLAKMLTTLDVLSGGRVMLGAGVGWLAEEFAALDTAAFADRGRVTDEYLQLFKRACVGGTVEFHGAHYNLEAAIFEPPSVQQPHIPVLIGGTSNVALMRVARSGDGWISVAVPSEQMPERIATLSGFCAQAGRCISTLKLHHKLFINIGEPRVSVHGGREPGTGSCAQIIDDIGRLSQLGITQVIVRYVGHSAAAQQDQLAAFALDVMPHFGQPAG